MRSFASGVFGALGLACVALAGCGGPDPGGGPPNPPVGGNGERADLGGSNQPDLGGSAADLGGSSTGCPGEGQSCSSGNPCASGIVRCTLGQSLCVDNAPSPNGTSCGVNRYCAAGKCQACTPGKSCNPTPCTTGVTECSTGTESCAAKGSSADGTSCGTDEVCKSGQCVACKAGVACAASGPCKTATISCATGAPICKDSGNAPSGTSCGVNQVCQSGACVSCVGGASCQPTSSPCKTGTLSCASGSPQCVATTSNQPDGTSCGTNYVCKAGTCASCISGGSCSAPSVCKLGVYSCSSGTQLCVDGANKPDGTSCGSNQVCAAGACGACTAGAPCTPANACHTGTTDCSTGHPVCKDAGSNATNGTSCGTNQYCYNGTCSSCVAGGACTPSDPCQTGSYICAGGQKLCAPSGSSGASSCGITTKGTCMAGACQCPAGSGIWNGDCAACPAFSSAGNFYVNADPTVGIDNQCCGRSQSGGFGGPCLTVTRAIKNIQEQALSSSIIWLRGDAQGNASAQESYPLALPAGLDLQTVADTCLPGAAGKEVLHVEQTGSRAVGVNPYWWSNKTQLTVGMSCAGTGTGASTGLYVGPSATVHSGTVTIAKTGRGVQISGGSLQADAGTLTINDVSGDGVFCQSTSATMGSLFYADGNTYEGHGALVTARVGGRAVYASSNCNFQGPIVLGSAPPCPAPKRDGEGLVADGDAYVVTNGAIQCMQGDGIALKTNAALTTNKPTVTFSSWCTEGTGYCYGSTVQHSGCAGGYAEVGKLTLAGVQLIHNHWGVHQKSSSASTDPANALIHVGPGSAGFSSAPPQSRLACNTKSEPGSCCDQTSCRPGADAFNESGLVLFAEGNEWEESPVSLCNCNAQLQSCACTTGSSTPPDGIDVLGIPGATTDVTNNKAVTPPMSCN